MKFSKQSKPKKNFKQNVRTIIATKFFYGDVNKPSTPSGENYTLGNGKLGKMLLGRSN